MNRLKSAVAVLVLFVGLFAGATSAQAAPLNPLSQSQATSAVGVVPSSGLTTYLASLTPVARVDFLNTKLPATQTVVWAQSPANFVAANSAVKASVTGALLSPMAVGCWTGRADWNIKALAGNTLYTYYHVGRWCSSGSTITSSSIADKGAQTFTVGWRYAGVPASGAGIVSNQGRSYTQHKFILGVGGWDVQTTLECGRIRGFTSGGAAADAVCGIY